MNNYWSFFNEATGVLDRGFIMLPERIDPQSFAPVGFSPVVGQYDHNRVRVNIDTGEIVPYQPPAPTPDEWQTWAWDEPQWCWLSVPTDAALARDIRAARDRRLAACDWIVARAVERAEPVPAAWAAYREALRNIPAQPDFPTTITWPEVPA